MTAHWLWFDGVEIANPTRTRSYINLAVPDVDTPLYCATCGPWSISESYADVAMDPAPWYDPNTYASREFMGLFVTRTGGFDDSTRAGNLIQLLGDGGAITGLRHEPREMRVSGTLIGLTAQGVEAGSSWLSSVLERGRQSNLCSGGVLTEWMSECSAFTPDAGIRQSRSVRCMSGPTVMGEQEGALFYQRVEFTLVSPSPRVLYRPVAQAAWVEGAQEVRRSGVTITSLGAAKAVCVPPADPVTVMNPNSTLQPLPPTAVTVPPHPASAASYTTFTSVFLPAGMSPSWLNAALSIRIHAPAARSNIRVRVIEQVDPAHTLAQADPCDLAGEFFIGHIPAGYSIEVDGGENAITGTTAAGGPALVSHLVSSSRVDEVMMFPVVKAGRAAWVLIDSTGAVGVSIEASTVLR